MKSSEISTRLTSSEKTKLIRYCAKHNTDISKLLRSYIELILNNDKSQEVLELKTNNYRRSYVFKKLSQIKNH